MVKIFSESFSKSLPDWLKKAVANLDSYNKGGIAWDSCTFEERPVPKSMRSAKKDDTKLPVFLVKQYGAKESERNKEVLVIPGLIEPVVYYNRIHRNYGSYDQGVYAGESAYSKWDILHYGVLDREGLSTRDKRNKRSDAKNGVVQRYKKTGKESGYWGDEYVDEFGNKDNYDKNYHKFDKSGYEIKNPGRYAQILKQNKQISAGEKYAKRLEKVYSELIDVRSKLREALDKDDISDNTIYAVESVFGKARREYNTAVYYIEKVLANAKDGKQGSWDSEHLENNLSEAEKYLEQANTWLSTGKFKNDESLRRLFKFKK